MTPLREKGGIGMVGQPGGRGLEPQPRRLFLSGWINPLRERDGVLLPIFTMHQSTACSFSCRAPRGLSEDSSSSRIME